MWKLMAVVVGVGALVAAIGTHSPVFAQGQEKTLICHVADDQQSFIIEVAVPAVPAHLEQHGDCLINSTDRSLIGDECDPTDANDNDICDIQP